MPKEMHIDEPVKESEEEYLEALKEEGMTVVEVDQELFRQPYEESGHEDVFRSMDS